MNVFKNLGWPCLCLLAFLVFQLLFLQSLEIAGSEVHLQEVTSPDVAASKSKFVDRDSTSLTILSRMELALSIWNDLMASSNTTSLDVVVVSYEISGTKNHDLINA